MIYHICTRQAWEQAQAQGEYRAPSLTQEGFIHFSSAAQVEKVANAFYRDVADLVLLCVDETELDVPLHWEAPAHPDGTPSQEGEAHFPHVYGRVRLEAVRDARPFAPDESGRFSFQA